MAQETMNALIHTEYIQLDQLLKYENIIPTGGQIRELLENQLITVNGILCTEKRKKIKPNDVVVIKDIATINVISEEA